MRVAFNRVLRFVLISLVATWAVSLARLARTWRRQPVRILTLRRVRRFAA